MAVSEDNTLLPSLLAESWLSCVLPAHVQSVCFLLPGPVTASTAVPAAWRWLSCAPAGSRTSQVHVLGSTGSSLQVKHSKRCARHCWVWALQSSRQSSQVRRSREQVLGWSLGQAAGGDCCRRGCSEPFPAVGARSELCPVHLGQVLLLIPIVHRAVWLQLTHPVPA